MKYIAVYVLNTIKDKPLSIVTVFQHSFTGKTEIFLNQGYRGEGTKMELK